MIADLSDEDLINKIKFENSSDAVLELSNRHSGIVNSCVNKYAAAAQASSGVSANELYNEKNFLIYSAAKDFDSERNVKFSTWLSNKTRYHCLDTLNSNRKYVSVDPQEINSLMEKEYFSTLDAPEIKEYYDYIVNLLDQLKDKRIKKIVIMRYFSHNKRDRSFKKIARKVNMSTQGVIDIHDSFISFLKNKLKSKENQDII